MGLFDRKKIEQVTVDPRNPQRQQVDSFLANYVSKYGNLYEPGKAYGGKFVAPLSGLENQGLEQFLPQYLNSPDVSPEMGNVRSLLQKTISGGFDPGTSEYYKALRDTSQYNRKKAVTDTNADLGARNKYFSSEAVQKYGDINAQTSNTLNQVMAQLADKERERQSGAVSQAAGLEKYISGIPLEKAQAATTLGSIPRMLEQADLEALYQDFIRRQDEGKGVVGAASGVSQTQTNQTTQQYAPSTFESTVLPIAKTAAQFLPMFLCWVAAEIFGGWSHPKTENCRYFISEKAPVWFRDFYMKHGERFAEFIHDKPIFKIALRPLFEIFSWLGSISRNGEVANA